MNTNGEEGYTFKCLAQCSTRQNNDLIADAIALNWYEDDLDQHPFLNTFGLIAGRITVRVGSVNFLRTLRVLRLYLSGSWLPLITYC